jgi:hypothetical protein
VCPVVAVRCVMCVVIVFGDCGHADATSGRCDWNYLGGSDERFTAIHVSRPSVTM